MSVRMIRASVWVAVVLSLTALTGGAYWAQSRRVPAIPTIAFIPQTAGPMLWEVEHFGATVAAEKLKCHLYWNAPTSENDLAGQVSLVDKVGRGRYQGLVLAPNHTLGIRAPVRRALAAGLPVVIVAADLELPAGNNLGYIVNDDEQMGELAAAELARLIHGKGSVALVGIARYAPGVMSRVRSAERFLAGRFPEIRVVSRLAGTYDTSRAEELTNDAIDAHPGLNAVLSFTASATRGVYAALKSRSLQQSIRLVGCEQDSDLIGYVGTGEIAAVLAENTYRMGYEAVGLIADSLAGKPMPARSVVPPQLITKQNFNSAGASLFTSFPR
jgi:ribose transport system substrate-binding protein